MALTPEQRAWLKSQIQLKDSQNLSSNASQGSNQIVPRETFPLVGSGVRANVPTESNVTVVQKPESRMDILANTIKRTYRGETVRPVEEIGGGEAVGRGVLTGLLGGRASSPQQVGLQPEYGPEQDLRAVRPYATRSGELAGFLTGIAPAGKAVGTLGKLAKVGEATTTIGKIGQRAATSGAQFGVLGAGQSAVEKLAGIPNAQGQKMTWGDVAKAILEQTAVGSVFGAAGAGGQTAVAKVASPRGKFLAELGAETVGFGTISEALRRVHGVPTTKEDVIFDLLVPTAMMLPRSGVLFTKGLQAKGYENPEDAPIEVLREVATDALKTEPEWIKQTLSMLPEDKQQEFVEAFQKPPVDAQGKPLQRLEGPKTDELNENRRQQLNVQDSAVSENVAVTDAPAATEKAPSSAAPAPVTVEPTKPDAPATPATLKIGDTFTNEQGEFVVTGVLKDKGKILYKPVGDPNAKAQSMDAAPTGKQSLQVQKPAETAAETAARIQAETSDASDVITYDKAMLDIQRKDPSVETKELGNGILAFRRKDNGKSDWTVIQEGKAQDEMIDLPNGTKHANGSEVKAEVLGDKPFKSAEEYYAEKRAQIRSTAPKLVQSKHVDTFIEMFKTVDETAAKVRGMSLEDYLIERKQTHGDIQFVGADKKREQALSQALGRVVKGQLEWKDGVALMRAYSQGDFSTYAHELSHYYRKTYPFSAAEEAAMVKEFGAKKKVFNNQLLNEGNKNKSIRVQSRAEEVINWDAAAEERFARSFERYLKTGKAPRPELSQLFAQMKEFMREIYRKVKGGELDLKLHPKIEAVFDGMFGKDTSEFWRGEERKALKRRETAQKNLESGWKVPLLRTHDDMGRPYPYANEIIGQFAGTRYAKFRLSKTKGTPVNSYLEALSRDEERYGAKAFDNPVDLDSVLEDVVADVRGTRARNSKRIDLPEVDDNRLNQEEVEKPKKQLKRKPKSDEPPLPDDEAPFQLGDELPLDNKPQIPTKKLVKKERSTVDSKAALEESLQNYASELKRVKNVLTLQPSNAEALKKQAALNTKISEVRKQISELDSDLFNPTEGTKDQGALFQTGGNATTSRFRPREYTEFSKPLEGPNGAKLVGYEWAWRPEEIPAPESPEGVKVKRVSDWEMADENSETGRFIVHKFHVKMPNGEVKVVSSESTLGLLGLSDPLQKSEFKNIASAAKTLAKNKLKLATMEARQGKRKDALARFKKEAPEVVYETDANGIKHATIGDVPVAFNADGQLAREISDYLNRTGDGFTQYSERHPLVKQLASGELDRDNRWAGIRRRFEKQLLDDWRDKYAEDMANRTVGRDLNYEIRELRDRIARQEKKLGSVTKSLPAAEPINKPTATKTPEVGGQGMLFSGLPVPELVKAAKWVASPATATASVVQRGFSNALSRLNKFESGKEFVQKTITAETRAKMMTGDLHSTLDADQHKLNKQDIDWLNGFDEVEKGRANSIALIEGLDDPAVLDKAPSQRVVDFALSFRKVTDKIASKAEDVGVKVTVDGEQRDFERIDAYFPHWMTRAAHDAVMAQDGPVWDAMLEKLKAVSGDDATYKERLAQLKSYSEGEIDVHREGSLEKPRLAFLPDYVTVDGKRVKILESNVFDVADDMIERHSRRLAIIEQFGQGDKQFNEYYRKFYNEDKHLAFEFKKFIAPVMQGLRVDLLNPQGFPAQVYRPVSALINKGLLSAAVLSQAGGVMAVPMQFGVRRTASAMLELMKAHRTGDIQEMRKLRGFYSDILKVLGETDAFTREGFEGTDGNLAQRGLRKVNRGMDSYLRNTLGRADRFLNDITSLTAVKSVNEALAVIKRGDDGLLKKGWGTDAEGQRRMLKRFFQFTDEQIDGMIERGKLSDEEKARVVQRAPASTNAAGMSVLDRPAWMHLDIAKHILAFSSYVQAIGRYGAWAVKEAKQNGNMRPIIGLLVGGAIGGEIEISVKNWFNDREREDKTFSDRLFQDILRAGVLGIAGSFYQTYDYTIRGGGNPVAEQLSPPPIDALAQLGKAIAKAGGEKSLAPIYYQSILRSLPAARIGNLWAERAILGDSESSARRLIRDNMLKQGGKTKDRWGRESTKLVPRSGRENTGKMLLRRADPATLQKLYETEHPKTEPTKKKLTKRTYPYARP